MLTLVKMSSSTFFYITWSNKLPIITFCIPIIMSPERLLQGQAWVPGSDCSLLAVILILVHKEQVSLGHHT